MALRQVRINANLKSQTVEELRGQKKAMHLAAFRYSLAETARDLHHLAHEQGAAQRLLCDTYKVLDGATYTVDDLLEKISRECKAVLARHAATPPERCAAAIEARLAAHTVTCLTS